MKLICLTALSLMLVGCEKKPTIYHYRGGQITAYSNTVPASNVVVLNPTAMHEKRGGKVLMDNPAGEDRTVPPVGWSIVCDRDAHLYTFKSPSGLIGDWAPSTNREGALSKAWMLSEDERTNNIKSEVIPDYNWQDCDK